MLDWYLDVLNIYTKQPDKSQKNILSYYLYNWCKYYTILLIIVPRNYWIQFLKLYLSENCVNKLEIRKLLN